MFTMPVELAGHGFELVWSWRIPVGPDCEYETKHTTNSIMTNKAKARFIVISSEQIFTPKSTGRRKARKASRFGTYETRGF
jgi:hypothetical protein